MNDKNAREIILESMRFANERSFATFGVEDGVPVIEQHARKADEVCDFCSARVKELTAQPCADFEVLEDEGRLLTRFRGAWNACPDCNSLIAAERWEELAERSVATSEARGLSFPEPHRRNILNKVRALHANFQKHRL